MSDFTVWIIIATFYAPLHFGAPILFLFITGREDEPTRARLIRGTVVDSSLSMLVALAATYWLISQRMLFVAGIVLFLSIFSPFVRIWLHRREIEN